MNALRERLIRQIAHSGPMSVADYMGACLLDPDHGYYATRDPFGSSGDFTTAPEISQMFGELVGLVLAQSWLEQGAPAPFCLAEVGPGRGTLMADILRATKAVPGFHAGLEIHLVEASAHLRDVQAKSLNSYTPRWHDHVSELPDLPLFLVANEFFDALPIRQFQRTAQGWCERQIAVLDKDLCFGLGHESPYAQLDHRLADTRSGDVVEICPAAEAITGEIATRIGLHSGAALFIDYGGWHSLGDTFQALSNHQMVDPLLDPGQADLTAHVDFEALQKAAIAASDRVRVSGLTPQGVFLERLGITARAQALARNMAEPALSQHIAAHHRLTHPDEMGTLFKVLGIVSKAAPPLPGMN